MIPGLIDHLWQSTLCAGAAWLVTLALKRNRAQVRYWVWLAASVKFLVPFSLLVGVAELAPKHTAGPMVQTEWVVVAEEVGRPLATIPVGVMHADRDFSGVLWLVWGSGFATVAFCFGRKWTRMNANVRTAQPIDFDLPIPVRVSAALYEPGIFGVFRPILLLPQGITERLSPAQFKAIIAHELCHVRRRDNLTATIHMLGQATFWFHPMVWWIGVRLIDERERACDEDVLRLGSSPQDYAEGILNVCKLYVESPVACVSGVTGSDLKKRIEAIMKNRIIQKLSAGRKVLLAGVGVVAAGIPVMIGFMHAPAVRAQSSTMPVPKWEVTSVRRCEAPPPDNGGRRGLSQTSPGRMTVRCGKVAALIQQAYVRYPDGQGINPHMFYETVDGGPSWIKSDLYDIEAKPEGTPSMEMMNGPMMQRLLEDRFKLKIHREVKEVPVYTLVIAKGGAKIPTASCPPMLSREEAAALRAAGKPQPHYCGSTDWFRRPVDTSAMTLSSHGLSPAEFASQLTRTLDRPVIDKTGLTGLLDFQVEFSADQVTPGLVPRDPDAPIAAADPTGPSFVTAIQEQLGLKLEPAKGPGDFLIIDSIDRPSDN